MTQAITRYLEARKRGMAERAIHDSASIVDHLQAFQSDTGAGRVLLIYASNGGGIPAAGKNIYITIVHELKDKELPPLKYSFQHMVTDSGYIRMLSEVLEKGFVAYDITNDGIDCVPEGFLKELYEKEGVQFAYVKKVKTHPDRFYFMSARWYKNDGTVPTFGNMDLAARVLLSKIEDKL